MSAPVRVRHLASIVVLVPLLACERATAVEEVPVVLSGVRFTPFAVDHLVPTFGYLISGTLEVVTRSGQSTVINQGEVAIEVMTTQHRGKAIGGPVEILVFYAGAVGLPNTLPVGANGCPS